MYLNKIGCSAFLLTIDDVNCCLKICTNRSNNCY